MVRLAFLPGTAKRSDSAGIISCVNKKFLDLTGYGESEVLGKSLTQFWQAPHDDLKTICRQFDKTGSWQALLQQRKKDGTTFQELVAVSRIPSAGDNGFKLLKIDYAISHAVSKGAVESSPILLSGISDSEKSDLDILNTAPYSITISRLSDGVYLEVNDAFCEFIGYSKKKVIGLRTRVLTSLPVLKAVSVLSNLW